MSENMTSACLQQIIETYVVNKDGQSTDVIGKPCAAAIATKKSNERRVLFIDDFSSTSSENYGIYLFSFFYHVLPFMIFLCKIIVEYLLIVDKSEDLDWADLFYLFIY